MTPQELSQIKKSKLSSFEVNMNPNDSDLLVSITADKTKNQNIPVNVLRTPPTWDSITDKPTLFNGAYSNLTGIPTEFSPSSHIHSVADIDATGTPDSTTYLRGDGTWSEVQAGTSVEAGNGITITDGDVAVGGVMTESIWLDGTNAPEGTSFGVDIGQTGSGFYLEPNNAYLYTNGNTSVDVGSNYVSLRGGGMASQSLATGDFGAVYSLLRDDPNGDFIMKDNPTDGLQLSRDGASIALKDGDITLSPAVGGSVIGGGTAAEPTTEAIQTADYLLNVTPKNNTTYRLLFLDGGDIQVNQPASPVPYCKIDAINGTSTIFSFGTTVLGVAESITRFEMFYVENLDPALADFLLSGGYGSSEPATGYLILNLANNNIVDLLSTSA